MVLGARAVLHYISYVKVCGATDFYFFFYFFNGWLEARLVPTRSGETERVSVGH